MSKSINLVEDFVSLLDPVCLSGPQYDCLDFLVFILAHMILCC